jgi:hypothetical protein
MKKRFLAAVGGAALGLTLLTAPADARPANPGAGGACVQQGIGLLKSSGLLVAAAQNKANPTIDYSALVPGLPEGSFLSLGQVVSAHATNPALFPWCQG